MGAGNVGPCVISYSFLECYGQVPSWRAAMYLYNDPWLFCMRKTTECNCVRARHRPAPQTCPSNLHTSCATRLWLTWWAQFCAVPPPRSFGVLMWEMFCGCVPWEQTAAGHMFAKNTKK